MNEIREWLERLYGKSPGFFGITAFTGGRPRKTKWYSTSALDAATRQIEIYSGKVDTYLSVGTHSEKQETRGGESTIISIPGFWGDLDIGEIGHKPSSLPNPPDEAAALSIIDGLPEPSMLMHSGGGLQGFWLFDEPWTVDSPEEKAKAKKAVQEWANLLEQRGKELGFHVDKVADLARILRVPGSMNHKEGLKRPVAVRWVNKPSNDREELTSFGIPDSRNYDPEPKPIIGDDFPLSWNEILAPHGYKQCDDTTWVRPGKECSEGSSLHVPDFASYVITNFSESDDTLKAKSYTKLKLYAELNYNGDVTKAKKHLPKRKLKLTWANTIEQKPVHWMWEGRIALGTLALLAGREGIGKSTLAYTLVADITKGLLPGAHYGAPRTVIIVATEDDWSFTIVPRLNAAKADLTKVARVEPNDPDEYGVSLPRDVEELSIISKEHNTALILLDPLMSRVDAKLDTHKDQEVRQALEPLVKMAGDSGAAVLGLLHVNKSGSTDPLSSLMGSRAFSAVARAVLYVVEDAENRELKVMGQPKNNLGRSDLPDLSYSLKSVTVGEWENEIITSVALNWEGEKPSGHIRQMLLTKPTSKSQRELAQEWIENYLQDNGKTASKLVKEAGMADGFSQSTFEGAATDLKRNLRILITSEGFPRTTYWESSEVNETIHPWELENANYDRFSD